jgi:hypothetical protein
MERKTEFEGRFEVFTGFPSSCFQLPNHEGHSDFSKEFITWLFFERCGSFWSFSNSAKSRGMLNFILSLPNTKSTEE